MFGIYNIYIIVFKVIKVINWKIVSTKKGIERCMAYSGKCPSCGKQLCDVKSCSNCGIKFDNDFKKILRRYQIKISIVIGLIIIFAFFGIKIFDFYQDKNNTPQIIVKNTLDAWQSGNAKKLYSYLDMSLLDKRFLSQKDLKESIKNSSLKWYEVKFLNGGSANVNPVQYKVKAIINNKQTEFLITAKKKITPDHPNGKWYIDPSIFLKELMVHCPDYISLNINGQKVVTQSNIGVARITVFKGYNLKIKYESEIINSEERNVIVNDDMITINPTRSNVNLSKTSIEKINYLISNFTSFNNNFTLETPYSEFEKYLEPLSSAWNFYESKLSPYAPSLEKIEKSSIEKIELNNDHILVYAKELKGSNTKIEYTTKYVLKLDDNGGFKISEIN